ncbi:DNA mismatch repair protein MutS [Candidatus Dependentiae bacterium Noda2021]|nr:DNA mismatch repair protein MutS [Candidatus Dependentiae bacterium Noda2021]
MSDLTPLMRQYFEIKKDHQDALVLFQVGDFYELFFDDAKKAAQFLGIALTKRGKSNGEPIPLCGVPVHTLDHYLSKLIKGGFKIAIAEQLEEPKPGTVVRRGVTQVLTPGTLTDGKWLSEKTASYLFSFFPAPQGWGLLFGELLTAQLYGTILPAQSQKSLESELVRFFPDEIIIPQIKSAQPLETYFKQMGYYTSMLTLSDDTPERADAWLSNQFSADTQGYLRTHEPLKNALSYFYQYIDKTQQAALEQFKSLHVYKPDDFLLLDGATQRNLELIKNAHDGSAKNTLFEVLDNAATPMGSRMIKKWIARPLVKKTAIEQRYDAIDLLVSHNTVLEKIKELLNEMGDLERIVGRIALKRAVLPDYLALAHGLEVLPRLTTLQKMCVQAPLIANLALSLQDFSELTQLLTNALNDDSTNSWLIKQGFDEELDSMRELVQSAHQKITDLELLEQQKTGINSLKIRYNQVHGYYIEITKANMDLVPAHYLRQQTLVGRERYMTPELQQLQHDIMRAKSEIEQVEHAVFDRIKQEVYNQLSELRKLAHALAYMDALVGLSYTAYHKGYQRPQLHDSRDIIITEGRHPAVEQNMMMQFIPNNTLLTNTESTWIITGPNMGGKSTYLRQVALIAIMAQIGSFVPAKAAQLPLLDRIFTRIGAGDNVAQGKSTFLVEMEETATICTQATSKSLVILDEVGRGTSTFDGLAIAQAVVEYIHNTIKARCLFATHYHELTHLQETMPGIVSYYAASKKTEHGIVFLYKIIKGIADGSFGVEVAKLAHLPAEIVERSYAILHNLSAQEEMPKRLTVAPAVTVVPNAKQQLLDSMHAQIRSIDYENLSPRQAFDLLWKFKEQLG